MAEKKEQHFVPQFYLRNFGLGRRRRRISLFNIPSAGYVPHASIKDQARKTWLYGRKSLEVEKALVDIEGRAAQVISGLLAGSALPAKNTLNYHGLLAFMVLQRTRTSFAANNVIESVNRKLAVIFGDDPRFDGLGTDLRLVHPYPALFAMFSVWAWPSLLDLKAKLVQAEKPLQFITSDNPVVHYNQFLEPLRPSQNNTGLFTKGLQILLPLSPELTLMLYDARVYRVGRKSNHRVIQLGTTDSDLLNGLQVMSAYSTLYFNQGTEERYVRRLLKSYRNFRIRPGADVEQYRHSSDPNRYLIHTRNVEIRCNLSLSFIRLHRRLRWEKLGNRLAVLRDDRMYDYIEEFEEAIKRKRLKREDFYFYLVAKGKVRPLALSNVGTGKSQ